MAGTGIYGELLKAQLENLASDPASTSVGRLYWNTTTQSARVYTSSGWDDLGGGGSGASGRNYLADWFDGDRDPGSVTNSITATGNITISTTAWQASDTSKLTVARTSSSPLRQTYSILLDHVATGAAFVQTPCFLLDAADLGKPVTVSFDVANVVTSDDYQVYAVRYTSGGTYQEQIPIIGTASATSPYSARIPTGTTKFQGFFIAGSTSTDYYVIRFYRNSASDTTDIKVDSLYAGPEKVVQGFGGTDPISWTPTGSWSSNTTYTGKYRYVGSFAEFELLITLSGAPTSAALTVNLPVTIDTAAMAAGTDTGNVSIGIANVVDASPAANYQGAVFYNSTTSVGIVVENSASTYGTVSTSVTQAVPITFASGDKIFARFSVPVVGRSSNVTMADRAVEEQCATSSTWDADDTGLASLVRGYAGGAITGALTTSRTKRVRFNTPIQVNDDIEIKFARGSGQVYTLSAQFIDASGNRIVNSESSLQTISTSSGVYWRPVSGSNTDIDVIFARYAALANDDSPAQDWVNGWYWIANKVSGGAAVGYPIGARNIVGDVSGTTVPSGYIGEVVDCTIAATTLTTSEADINGASLPLTPGVWLIQYSLSAYAQTGATASNATYAKFAITDNSNNHISKTERLLDAKTVANIANYVGGAATAMTVVSISANTTYKLRGTRVDPVGTGTAGVYASAGNYNSTFFAVRIA